MFAISYVEETIVLV